MVPFGLNQDQFVAAYRRSLDYASKGAVTTIHGILAQPFGPGVDHAHVEIFADEAGGAPSVWIYHSGKNNKVDRADQSIFPGKASELALDPKPLGDFDEKYFTDPETFPGTELTVPLLARWFSECWWKAGGWFYPVPTTLTVHDYESFGSTVLSEGGS